MNIKSYLTAITLLLSLPLVMETMEEQDSKAIEAMEEDISQGLQRIANLEKTRVYLREQLEAQRENAPLENQAIIAQMQEEYDAQQRVIECMKNFLIKGQNYVNGEKASAINGNNK